MQNLRDKKAESDKELEFAKMCAQNNIKYVPHSMRNTNVSNFQKNSKFCSPYVRCKRTTKGTPADFIKKAFEKEPLVAFILPAGDGDVDSWASMGRKM